MFSTALPLTWRNSLSALLLIAACFVLFASKANAQELDRPAVENIIREYLLANPELFLEVQQALAAKQEEIKKQQQMATLVEMNDKIYNSPNQMIIGNPDAKVSVVEFFDYNCSYCKRALSDMTKIVAENPDVKFIMKEFPVLGEPSLEAHRISLALIQHYPELYADYHHDLMNLDGRKDGNAALDLAVAMGADSETLKATANDPSIMSAVAEVYELADGLGITGTPSYVIGDEVVFGAVGYDKLMPKIKNLRKCGNAVC
ncbi:MAG: DsbA family protein [Salaquimonas sp.]